MPALHIAHCRDPSGSKESGVQHSTTMSGGNPYSQYSGTADGPPSWVDTGTTTSGSDGESLTYWEEKFGGGSSSSASGPPPSVDVSAFLPDYKKTDEGEAVVYYLYIRII